MPKYTCSNCPTPVRWDSKTGLCLKCYTASRKPAPSTVEDGISVTGDTAVLNKTTTENVRTLEDLIRVCEIDTETWNIVSYECKASQQYSVPRATRRWSGESWVRPDTTPVLSQMFHVSAKLKRKGVVENTVKLVAAQLLEDIRRETSNTIRPRWQPHKADYLFEFTPFDLHMGKYTWSEETVTNYDIDIATDLFNASIDFLLNRALRLSEGKLDRVLCVFGNDVSHIDTKQATTTAGTYMDVDGRYAKVYRRICAIHRRAVDILRQIAPVDIVICPGNHDELTAFHLGELLTAQYGNDPHITVDNSPRPRKYYRYGVNLFGFAHGNVESVNELPLAMAREVPELWAQCPSREWHIGHKHITERMSARNSVGRVEQDYHSDKGVRIRRLTSLSGHDVWHTKHAYMDRRACESFLFHKTAGFTDQLSFNVDHFTGEALSK